MHSSKEAKNEKRARKDDVDERIARHIRLNCEQCSENFQTFGDLKNHFQDVHSTKGYVLCCGRKFHKRSVLNDHVEKHINPNRFK